MRACHPANEQDAALAERVGRLETLVERGVPAAPGPAPEKEKPKAPAPEKARPRAEKPAPAPAGDAPPQYLQAVEALSKENPSLRAALAGMKFAGFDGAVVTAEFPRKQMMFMKMLERKQDKLNAAIAEAFGTPVKLAMRLEGDGAAAAAPTAAQARRVIEQSYDVFGRENIDLTD